jgi:hypothetical protein
VWERSAGGGSGANTFLTAADTFPLPFPLSLALAPSYDRFRKKGVCSLLRARWGCAQWGMSEK